jgi:anti-sigma-K factor RskA
MSVSANLRLPSFEVLPSSTLIRRFMSSAPIIRGRSATTLEPKTGSPTGRPTGAILMKGATSAAL